MKGAIWGLNKESAYEQLQQLKENYISSHITVIEYYDNEHHMICGNGDTWQICLANDHSRGHSFNVSYIDQRIDEKIINCIIKPATKSMPYQAINYF